MANRFLQSLNTTSTQPVKKVTGNRFLDATPVARPVATTSPTTTKETKKETKKEEKKPGILKKVGKFFLNATIDNTKRVAENVGGIAATTVPGLKKDVNKALQSQSNLDDANAKLLKQIIANRKAGKDTTRLEKVFNDNMKDRRDAGELVPVLNKSNLQVVADWAGLGLDIATAGSLASLGKKAAAGTSFKLVKDTAKVGAKALITEGTAVGASYGLTGSLQEEDPSIGKSALSTVVGAGVGAAIPAAIIGLGKLYSKSKNRFAKAVLDEALDEAGSKVTSNSRDLIPISSKTGKRSGKVITNQIGDTTQQILPDKVVQNAQNIPVEGKIAQEGTEQTANLFQREASDLSTAQTKTSKFAENVATSPITAPETAKEIQKNLPTYEVQKNADAIARAKAVIDQHGTELVAQKIREADEPSASVVTTGIELIKRYQQEGKHELAASMADDISLKLTKAGQTVQAAKMYQHLSPEAILIDAQRYVDKQNKRNLLLTGKVALSEDDAKMLYEAAKEMQTATGDYKEELAAQIGAILGSYKRNSLGAKISSVQTQAQLLNPKTLGRNAIGNELFYRVEQLTKLVALPIDIARSKLTGADRTITFKAKNQEKFFLNFMRGLKAGWKGETLGISNQFQVQNKVFKSAKNPFYWGEKALGASLKSFDYAAYKRATGQMLADYGYLRAMKEGYKGADLKRMAIQFADQADEAVMQMADEYGKFMTFQDDNIISKGLVGIKQALNLKQDFGLGDLLLKYPKTPGALLARAIDYSPMGFIRSLSLLAEPFFFGTKKTFAKDRDIAMSLSRAITGTVGMTGLGYFLADKGLITGKRDKSSDVAGIKEALGSGEYKINISALKRFVLSGFKNTHIGPNDVMYSYDWAQPISVALSIGANMGDNSVEGLGDALASGANTVVEQPVLSGLMNFMKYGDLGQSLSTTAESSLASFTPTLLNQFRQYTDNIKRQTKGESTLETILNRAKNRIPGAERDLAPQVDVLGKTKVNFEKNNIFNVFFNPGTITTLKDIPEAQLVLDLVSTTGERKQVPNVYDRTVTLFGEKTRISNEEQAAMQQYTGKGIMKALESALERDDFNSLTDEEKVDIIAKKLTELGSNARALLTAKRLLELKNAGETEMAQEMIQKVSENDTKRVQAAIDMLKSGADPFKIEVPENNGNDRGTQSSKVLPIAGLALGVIATKGKTADDLAKYATKELTEEATEQTSKNVSEYVAKTGKKVGNATKLFSKEAAEESAQLLAIHSTTGDALRNIVKDGKIWGPSVAVFDKAKAKFPFGFGDYHIVLNKKSINPANKDVIMFTDDVFSPRLITNEFSLNKLKKEFEAGVSLKGGEITEGKAPLTMSLAERVTSFIDLKKKREKLGTRKDAQDSYWRMLKEVTANFKELVPDDIRKDFDDYAFVDVAEDVISRLSKLKTVDAFKDPKGIQTIMKKDYDLNLSTAQAQRFIDSLNTTINNIKVEYFEAKVLRGVNINEIDTVLVPHNAPDEIVQLLKANNIRTVRYSDDSMTDAFSNVAKSAFGIGIIPFFKSKQEQKDMLDKLKAKFSKKQAEVDKAEQYRILEETMDRASAKPAKISVYNPVASQTDSDPHMNGFMRKPEFGDVAIGNRDEYEAARAKYFKTKEETFIVIPELKHIRTPYGNGKFRVSDTMNKRFDGQNKIDVFIPTGEEDLEMLVRKVPTAKYWYSRPK